MPERPNVREVTLYPEPPRPRMCPEPVCRPLVQYPGYTREQRESGVREWERGESWFCWGVMPEVVTFTYGGVEHPNDLRSCVFTPIKGLISFQENRDDWWGLRLQYDRALEQLDAYRRATALDGGQE